jgi:hypothetical protein
MKRLGDLLSGEGRSFGTWAQIPSPEVIDMIGLNGFDFVVVDCQHAPFGIETAERMARSAAATGLAAGVRVSRLDEVEILKALDAGLGHVVVPDIASAVDAARAVDATRFAPHGSRGACPCVRSGGHFIRDWRDYAGFPAAGAAFGVVDADHPVIAHEDRPPVDHAEAHDTDAIGHFEIPGRDRHRRSAVQPDDKQRRDRYDARDHHHGQHRHQRLEKAQVAGQGRRLVPPPELAPCHLPPASLSSGSVPTRRRALIRHSPRRARAGGAEPLAPARLIEEGAVAVNGAVVSDPRATLAKATPWPSRWRRRRRSTPCPRRSRWRSCTRMRT